MIRNEDVIVKLNMKNMGMRKIERTPIAWIIFGYQKSFNDINPEEKGMWEDP